MQKVSLIFKLLALLAPVALAVGGAWWMWHELSLCAMSALATLLLLGWIVGFPSESFIRSDHVNKVRSTLRDKVYQGNEYLGSTRPPVKVRELYERLNRLRYYALAVVRSRDSEEFIDECEEGITKALILYAFVLVAAVMGYYQSNQPMSEETARVVASIKFYVPFVYVSLTLAYVCWFVSPVMLHRRRNHAVSAGS